MLRERMSYIHHLVGSNHHADLKHRGKHFVFTIAFVIFASAVALGAGIYSAMEISKLAAEVENIRAGDSMAINSNIESLIASRDLAAIVEASVTIANKDIQNDAKRYWFMAAIREIELHVTTCLLYTSPSPRDKRQSRMPSSA